MRLWLARAALTGRLTAVIHPDVSASTMRSRTDHLAIPLDLSRKRASSAATAGSRQTHRQLEEAITSRKAAMAAPPDDAGNARSRLTPLY